MSERTAARAAWSLWALAVLLVLAMVALAVAGGMNDVALGSLSVLAVVGYGTAGALIASRRRGNAIGWLFLVVALGLGLIGASEGYLGLTPEHPSLPLVGLVAWLGSNVGLVVGFAAIPLVLLLFPTGRAPSPRWRPVTVAMIVGPLLGLTGFAISTNPLGGDVVKVPNPTALPRFQGLATALMTVGAVTSLLAAGLCIAALVVRFRRSRGEERQQMRWLAYSSATAGALLASVFAVGALLGDTDTGPDPLAVGILFHLFLVVLGVGIPVAAGIAILRHRLYDIDVVINKTLVYGSLAAFITGVYVAIVVGIGQLVGAGEEPNLGLSILATAVVALAFQPVRSRVQHLANRLVYGRRATPYEVLTSFSERVGGSYAAEDVLPRMARVLAEGTGAARAEVWLRTAGALHVAGAWPEAAPAAALELTGDELPALPGADHAAPVRHHGELLGALSIAKPRGEPLSPAEAALTDDLAAQAGLVLRNVRLLEELRASRERLVKAQDAERRRIERDIHDGAQQQLVALAVKLRLAESLVGKDPAKAAELLAGIKAETTEALETLRDLARGIYPPLLADQGLPAALAAQARKVPLPVEVASDGVGRYPQEVEAAVYFCCLEALQNAAKYSGASRVTVRLAAPQGELRFEVEDDGRGFDPERTPRGAGLQNMADRLEALGGRLEVRSAPGHGTTVAGGVPVRTDAAEVRAAPASATARPAAPALP